LSCFDSGTEKKLQIHVYDKFEGRSFYSAARNLATERDFYDFAFLGCPLTLEPSLSQLEGEAAECFKALVSRRRLAMEESELIKERSTIVRFLAAQLVRTKGALSQQEEIREALRQIFSNAGAPQGFFKPPIEVCTEENALKANFAARICEAHKELGSLLVRKSWILFETTKDCPFLLGDNPVVLDMLSRKLFENVNSLFANESDGYKTTSAPSAFRFSYGRSAS
jgi:hypothetical protein